VGLGLELQNQQFMHRKQVILVLLILLPVVELRGNRLRADLDHPLRGG
jgi:hypothetical protein